METDLTHLRRELVVARTDVPVGLRLAGEIDASNVDVVREVFSANRWFSASLHVDLTELLFCDVSGIRAIVSYADGLDGGRRLRLHGLPAKIEKVMNVMGWAEISGLEFCSCDLAP